MTRWFLVWLLGGAGLLSAAQPNIIVFMVDDYDKYETSVYGGKVLTIDTQLKPLVEVFTSRAFVRWRLSRPWSSLVLVPWQKTNVCVLSSSLNSMIRSSVKRRRLLRLKIQS